MNSKISTILRFPAGVIFFFIGIYIGARFTFKYHAIMTKDDINKLYPWLNEAVWYADIFSALVWGVGILSLIL